MEKMHELLEIMARLRDPEHGCPWDRQQDFASIAPYTVEEAYEVADAIEQGDMAGLRDELGDLLFQVVFHSRLAEEQGYFSFSDVTAAIVDKMLRRHPHVFGGERIADAEAQTRAWEEQKARERAAGAVGDLSALDGVARTLPALARAMKLQKRAARAGFDWRAWQDVAAKVEEELGEVRAEIAAGEEQAVHEEIGDLMFACVNLARHAGVDPELALRAANAKFERRFKAVEAGLAAQGKRLEDTDLEEMDAHWERAKQAGKDNTGK